MPTKQTIVMLCAWLLVCPPLPAWGWQAGSQELEIVVLRGDGTTHLISRHGYEQPVVVVRSGGQPVKGAVVVFRAPRSGPGGSFLSSGEDRLPGQGQSVFRVTTGGNGRAVSRGFAPNEESGDYSLRISTSYRGQTAESRSQPTTVAYREVVEAKKVGLHPLTTVGIIAGAVFGVLAGVMYSQCGSGGC